MLRLMRENTLLSPHRARPRPQEPHDRKIVTMAGAERDVGDRPPDHHRPRRQGLETNCVIERLFRTIKEQVVYGRIFQTIEEVRDAVRSFVVRYNTE